MDVDALLAKLVAGTLSEPRSGDIRSVRIRPVEVKGRRCYQFESRRGAQAFHKNLDAEAAAKELRDLLGAFRQGDFKTEDADLRVLDGRARTTPAARPAADARHDREKAYLLPEGEPVPFLVKLGVMTPEGKVRAPMRDKFRQMNRFLEFVADVLPALPDGKLKVVDFGSGKSYLTFALAQLLRDRDVEIVGLDLKRDVVERCEALARELKLDRLRFEAGDIAGWSGRADLVVSLHACDTATDAALAKAVEWDAKAVLAVPCCQHELARSIASEPNAALLKHGILKERLASLVTDAMRAELLETAGYDVQVMEFVDTEHTPKNLLLRAVRSGRRADRRAYEALRTAWGAAPALERLLKR